MELPSVKYEKKINDLEARLREKEAQSAVITEDMEARLERKDRNLQYCMLDIKNLETRIGEQSTLLDSKEVQIKEKEELLKAQEKSATEWEEEVVAVKEVLSLVTVYLKKVVGSSIYAKVQEIAEAYGVDLEEINGLE